MVFEIKPKLKGFFSDRRRQRLSPRNNVVERDTQKEDKRLSDAENSTPTIKAKAEASQPTPERLTITSIKPPAEASQPTTERFRATTIKAPAEAPQPTLERLMIPPRNQFCNQLSEQDRIFIYCPEDNSLQDESSLADLSTIAGSLESYSFDYSYLGNPGSYETIPSVCENSYEEVGTPGIKSSTLKIVGIVKEEEGKTDYIFPKPETPDKFTQTQIGLDFQLEEEVPNNDPSTLGSYPCCIMNVDDEEAKGASFGNDSILSPLHRNSAHCVSNASQSIAAAIDCTERQRKKVSFRGKFTSFFMRPKEEMDMSMAQCSNRAADSSTGCENEDPGCYDKEITVDLSKCPDSDPCACITASRDRSFNVKEVEILKEWGPADSYSVSSSRMQDSYFDDDASERFRTETVNFKTKKLQNEKWNEFVAQLEMVQQGADGEVTDNGKRSLGDVTGNGICGTRLEEELLKTFDSGKSPNMKIIIEDAEDILSRAGVGLTNALLSALNLVPEELIRCFENDMLSDSESQ